MAIEILAPAGSPEHLTAAVRCSTDAVYLGGAEFNARRNAENFDTDTLTQCIKYCHERNVKVYVAVNILISDSEIPSVIDYAKKLAEINADGVIVQDFAAARIFKEVCPELPLHASTQMTVHNKSGVRLLQNYGFKRFVPAREMSLPELKNMCECSDSEVEVFVHGALCMSVSGCCYISSMLGGRSGNRGLCAQSCRLDFKAGNRRYALSLKDMSYVDHITELENIGVCSLKIEGRMKRPEYVAAAVTACRKAVNGEKYNRTQLKSVFSRSGFTDGYLTAKRDLSMFGYRTVDDVTAATGDIYAELHEAYRNELQSIPLKAVMTVTEEKTELVIQDGKNTVYSYCQGGDVPEKYPLSKENAEKNIAKTGGTPYYIDGFEFNNVNNLFLPASCINQLRRDALDKLAEMKNRPLYSDIRNFTAVFREREHSLKGYIARFAKKEQIFSGAYKYIIVPVDEILSDTEFFSVFKEKLIAETPSLIFENDEDAFLIKIQELKKIGVTKFYADNIGQIQMLKDNGTEIFGGFGLNILNSLAVDEYKKIGLSKVTVSFEADVKKIKNLKTDIDIIAVTYGYLPLMKYRSCPLKTEHGCGKCKGFGVISDRKNVDFPIICEKKRYSVMYNSVPLDVGDKDFSFVDYKLLFFTSETKDECLRIFDNALNCRLSAEKHTNGLYYRELL